MDKFNLKDKLQVTKEYLEIMSEKGWQEIEYLQNQISNIEPDLKNKSLIQLLQNLLTSYYIFTGGLENLTSNFDFLQIDNSLKLEEPIDRQSEPKNIELADNIDIVPTIETGESNDENSFEPFEYFVDFDEPTGEALSDEDLYGKN